MLFFGIIRAIDPIDGDLKKWSIELDLPCSTIDEANEHCQNNELGYVLIEGKLDLETNLLLKGIQIIKIGLQLEVWKNDELKILCFQCCVSMSKIVVLPTTCSY